jgi:hypothetical protein
LVLSGYDDLPEAAKEEESIAGAIGGGLVGARFVRELDGEEVMGDAAVADS